MYERGRGVVRNYAEALKWFRLAADQGFAFAQFNLGLFYEKGLRTLQDYVHAMMVVRSGGCAGVPRCN
jgi:TPR repeat protein